MTTADFTAPDGLRLSYETWGEPGRLPPVVLHHGFAADARVNWVVTGIVERLRQAGREVIALDARGHGRSEKPHDPACYGEARMAEDLTALVASLGRAQVDLVGYSMGAVVSLLFASRSDRLRRLVVGGVGSGVVECGGVDRRVVSNDSIMAALGAESTEEIDALDPAAGAFRRLADAIGADRRALLAQASSIYRGGVELGAITAPTLVLAGSDDPLADRPEVLAAEIQDVRLQYLPGDHMTVVGDPRFADAIVSFLGR